MVRMGVSTSRKERALRYSRMALIETRGESEEKVRKEAERFASSLRGSGSAITILGPAPAVIGKIKKNYRWHVMVKSPKDRDPGGVTLRHALATAYKSGESHRQRDVRLIIDVDPVGLM